MIDLVKIRSLAHSYNIPIEDVLFVALNINGVAFKCDFNRMRMGVRLTDKEIFSYSFDIGISDFYFALAVNDNSPFSVIENHLLLDGRIIAEVISPTEDFCDSNYSRRNGTVLNINPNSRTSCRGCGFCYTGYQVPRDNKRMLCEIDLVEFFEDWMKANEKNNLSHLIQVAVVTGCYNSGEELVSFLLILKKVLNRYDFKGEIFYLGSQITNKEALERLIDIQPFCYCFSLECFENRQFLLNKKKSDLGVDLIFRLMNFSKSIGYRVNFSYVLGLESLFTMEKYFLLAKQHINSFPIINTIQIHKYHSQSLLSPEAINIDYLFEARKRLELIFSDTDMGPREWENYRSLWFMEFNKEKLLGVRTP
jgi:hypothetical protein